MLAVSRHRCGGLFYKTAGMLDVGKSTKNNTMTRQINVFLYWTFNSVFNLDPTMNTFSLSKHDALLLAPYEDFLHQCVHWKLSIKHDHARNILDSSCHHEESEHVRIYRKSSKQNRQEDTSICYRKRQHNSSAFSTS